jgi:hypothetical protein
MNTIDDFLAWREQEGISKGNSLNDLRILNEMADEIQKYGTVGLPGSLRKLIKTQRGLAVGFLLEKLANDLLMVRHQDELIIDRLKKENNALRDEMQLVTDRLEALESENNLYRLKKS